MKRIALFLFLILSVINCFAQTQIDPTYQIQWNALAYPGAPAANGITCTQNGNYTVYPYGAEWGQSYQDTTNNVEYKCTTSGWVNNLPTTGGTLTGPLSGTSASFSGTVAVGTSLSSPLINSIVYCPTTSTILACANSVPSSGVVVVLQGGGAVYQSGTTPGNTINKTVWIEGSGSGSPNAAYTALTCGSTIQGNLVISGAAASNSKVEHLCVDVGSAFIGSGSVQDGLSIGGTGYAPLVGAVVNDVSVLGTGPTSSNTAHGIIAQGTDKMLLTNNRVFLAYNGIVLKGTNAIVRGNFTTGNAADGIIIKANSYAPTSNVTVEDNTIQTYSGCDTAGIVIQSEDAAISNVIASNNHFNGICNAPAIQIGSELGSWGSYYTTNVHLHHNIVNGGTGDTYGSCVFWNGPAAYVTIDGLICNNISGAVNMYYANLNDAGSTNTHGVVISNVSGAGINQAIQTRGIDTQLTNVVVSSFSPAVTVLDGNAFAVNVIQNSGAALCSSANGCPSTTGAGNFYLAPYTQLMNHFTAPQYFQGSNPAYMQLLGGNALFTISAWSITGNVVTFTTSAQNLAVTNQVTLSGFATSTFFNGQVLAVLNTGLTSTSFQAAFTHANGSATEAGSASVPNPNYSFWESNSYADPCSTQIRNTGSAYVPYYGFRVCYGLLGSIPAWRYFYANAGVNGSLSYSEKFDLLSTGDSVPPSHTVATLPAGVPTGTVALVTDSFNGSCTTGASSSVQHCYFNGTVWIPVDLPSGAGANSVNVGTSSQVAQSASISATTIYTPSTNGSRFAASCAVQTTTAGTAGTVSCAVSCGSFATNSSTALLTSVGASASARVSAVWITGAGACQYTTTATGNVGGQYRVDAWVVQE